MTNLRSKQGYHLLILLLFCIVKETECFVPVHLPVVQVHSIRRSNNLSTTRILPTIKPVIRSHFHSQLRLSSENWDLQQEQQKGIWVLLTVPVAWGTFEPAVRYVYQVQPDIPPFVFQFMYYLVAASSLLVLTQLFPGDKIQTPALSERVEDSKESGNWRISPSTWGGIELGTYLFLGNGLQVVGLKTVPSDRAAFLLQLTTIFVPLVQSLFARNLGVISKKTWIACFVALAGVFCIGLDGTRGDIDPTLPIPDGLSFSSGDVLIILAALFYTFHCLRLDTYSKKTSAVELAASKASTETFWCAVVVVTSLACTIWLDHSNAPAIESLVSSGQQILDYRSSLVNDLQASTTSQDEWYQLIAATMWTGLVTIAYTITAQSFGQARVPATTANLIYTIQPFFTAIVAYLVLGERLQATGYIGGALIAAAVILVIEDGTSNT